MNASYLWISNEKIFRVNRVLFMFLFSMVDKKNCEKCGSQIKIAILLCILVIATKTCKAAICSRCKNRNSFCSQGAVKRFSTKNSYWKNKQNRYVNAFLWLLNFFSNLTRNWNHADFHLWERSLKRSMRKENTVFQFYQSTWIIHKDYKHILKFLLTCGHQIYFISDFFHHQKDV